jgi:hypothetical protein
VQKGSTGLQNDCPNNFQNLFLQLVKKKTFCCCPNYPKIGRSNLKLIQQVIRFVSTAQIC